MQYMRANGCKTYFVTGGGQDFVRVFSEWVYGIPPEQVVGSAADTSFGYDKAGNAVLTKTHKMLFVDDKAVRRVDAQKAIALTKAVRPGGPQCGPLLPWVAVGLPGIKLAYDR